MVCVWKCTWEESASWSLWSVVPGLIPHADSHVPFLTFIALKQTQGYRGWRVCVVVFLGKNKVGAGEITAKFYMETLDEPPPFETCESGLSLFLHVLLLSGLKMFVFHLPCLLICICPYFAKVKMIK